MPKEITLKMTRERALELDLITCKCGHRKNNHFDFSIMDDSLCPCARCGCKNYTEKGISGVIISGK